MFFLTKVNPNPTRILNNGPAIDPAIAISPYPFFAREQFTDRSI